MRIPLQLKDAGTSRARRGLLLVSLCGLVGLSGVLAASCSGSTSPLNPAQPNPLCSFAVSAPSRSVYAATGGSGTVVVTTASGCSWSARAGAVWLSISSGNTWVGAGTATFSVAANSALAERTGTVTVAGHTFSIQQSGAAASFVGGWHNVAIDEGSTTWIVIRSENSGSAFVVHEWSECSVGPCDWGEVTTPAVDASGAIELAWDRGTHDVTQRLSIGSDGRLLAASRVRFKDGSGRPDSEVREFFIKAIDATLSR